MQQPTLTLTALAVAACYAGSVSALPTAPSVAVGQALISVQGKTLHVVNTPGTIINWRGFSIGADEAARFQQQSAASSVLNRVVGQDPSAILGQLQSNGRVFVINPNGIVFGAGAQIDVAGLIASSLHLSNADFAAGRLQFREQGTAGAVVNRGEIRTPIGGQVYLVAPRVENHGLITTPGGDIVLAAGKKVEIVDARDPAVRIEIAAPENEALNMGRLVAAGGRISMLGSALRISGRVSADAAVVENGRVAFRRTAAPAAQDLAGTVNLKASDTLTVEAGAVISADGPVAGRVTLQSDGGVSLRLDTRISASGAIGGKVDARATTGALIAQGIVEAKGEDGPGGGVRLTGDRVALLQRSRTDASGTEGGGTVLVGGGYQGNDASTQNARRTVVATEAQVRADAVVSGDGGTVVLWSDESTRFHGEISARGAGDGAGGLVETSGKRHLEFAGRVDVSAQSGRGGTLLLDPLNIVLTASDSNTAGFNAPADIQELFADDAGLTSSFNVAAGGSFAGIAAGSNIVLQATNNITASSAFNIAAATGNSDVSLTLQANNSIAINAAISTSGNGSLTLIADNDGVGGGAITRTAAGTLATGNGGSITLNASTGLNASVSTPSVSVRNRTSGAVIVTSTGADGAIAFAGSSAAGSIAVTASNGTVTQSGAMTVTGISTYNVGVAGDVTLANASNSFGTVTVTSARDVRVADVNAVILGASVVSGNLALSANGAVTQSGAVRVAGTANIQAGANAITLATATNNFNIVEAAGQAVSLRDANTMTLGNVSAGGALTVVTNGALDQAAGSTVSAVGTTTLTAGAGNDITLQGATNNFNVLRVVSGRNVGIKDANGLSLGAGTSTVSGNLALGANGAVTQSAALVVAGTANLQAGAGSIVLTTSTNNFNSVVAAGQSISLRDANAMTLGNVTAAGNLTLQTNGALAQAASTAISAGGNTTITAPTNRDITLANAGNDFTNLRVASGRNVQVTDANGLNLGGSGASVVSGTLVLNANGAVTQSSQLSVTGLATFNIGSANDLTLGHASNAFSTVSIASAGNATLFEAGGFALGAANVGNNLTVTSTGVITDTGNITVPGRLTVETRNNAARAITLDSVGNNFGSVSAQTLNAAGTAAVAGAITLREASAMELAQLRTSGAATLTANGALTQSGAATVGTTLTANVGAANDVTLANASNSFGTVTVTSARDVRVADVNAVILGASVVSGNLALSANGAVTQSGAVRVAGTANIQAGANAITLATATNNFNIVEAAGQAVSLRDANTMTLGNVSAGGALTVVTNGALDQAAGSTVSAVGTTTLTAGAGNDITLQGATNNFNVLRVVSGRNVGIKDANGLSLGAGTSTVSGNLALGANGAVTQSAALVVAGTANFATGSGDLTLLNTGNNFGTVLVSTTGNAGLLDANAITLGKIDAANLLLRTTNGHVTQSGAITVPGLANFSVGNANNITLTDAANDLGTLRIANANAVSIVDANALQLGGGASVVRGTLNLTTGGAVTQSSQLSVTGLATFNTGTHGLALDHASNAFSTVAITGAGNAKLRDVNAVGIAASNVGGSLDVTAIGITVSGNVSTAAANGVISFNAGTGTYTQNANIDVAAGAGNITVAANALTLNTNAGNNALQTSGTLTLSPGTTGQAITVAGTGYLTAAELNSFVPGLNNAGGALRIGRDDSTAAMTIGSAYGFGAGSRVTLAAGSIGDGNTTNRTLTAGDLALFSNNGTIGGAAASNAIDVAVSNLSVGSNGQNAFIRSAGALNFGPGSSNLGAGSLAVTTVNAALTQGGAIVATGAATTFNTGSAALTLGHAGNDFGSVQVTNAGNTAITDANAMALAGANVNGTLSLKTGSALTQTGALTATGLVTLDAGTTGNVTLTHAGNNFDSVTVTTANNVSLADAGGIDLGAFSVHGVISVVAGGDVSLSGVLQAAGAGNALVLAAGGNFLNNAGSAALSTTSGRWLVYSSDPALNTFGGLASGNGALWSHTYAANPPAGVTQAGNRYLFPLARALTATAADFAKVYGDDVAAGPAAAYTVAGLNTNTWGGAILADTAASVLSGAPQVNSVGAAAAAAVTGSPYAFTLGAGTLAPLNGYTLSVTGAGQLTVTPAALSIGVQDASRRQGVANPPFVPSYSGFRAADGPGALGGTLRFSTTAEQGSPPGSYAVTPFGVSSSNYSVTFRQGTLRIDPQFTGDPLQGAHGALFGASAPVDLLSLPPSIGPLFVLAAADLPLEQFLAGLPPTASGGGERFVLDCHSGSPIGQFNCRRRTARSGSSGSR
ncbi:MAG: filamentous hemagglutinin N-terminal domain-containing protein [Burkholderiales bacterium]